MTIEERINQIVEGHAECRWLDAYDLRKYLEQIATEQKAIDDAELARLKKAWEKEVEVNHDAEMAYKQGRHDAIDKACAWLRKRTVFYATRDKGFFLSAFVAAFRKEMMNNR